MLMLLAPSKTMDFETMLPYAVQPHRPLFERQAAALAGRLDAMNFADLKVLMKVSDDITGRVQAMYAQWPNGSSEKPALWTYKGDVYKGMKAELLPKDAALWADEHLLILSGLYGLVRPLDLIKRYRLEMKAALSMPDAKNLYEFWGRRLADYAVQRLEQQAEERILYNLSSNEYAHVVTKWLPKDIRVITPVFYDVRPNGVGRAPIYNKMMRGVLCRWMIEHRAETPDQLHDFKFQGYAYDASRSTDDAPAFFRSTMTPLDFSYDTYEKLQE